MHNRVSFNSENKLFSLHHFYKQFITLKTISFLKLIKLYKLIISMNVHIEWTLKYFKKYNII